MTSGSSPQFEEVFIEEFWVEDSSEPRRKPPTRPERPSVPDLVRITIDEGRRLIMAQIELFKIKAKVAGARLGAAIGLILVAVTLLFYFIWWTFHTIEVALTYAVPQWAASLIVWAILLVAIAACLAVGAFLAKRASEEAPSIDGITTDIESVKDAVREGKNQ